MKAAVVEEIAKPLVVHANWPDPDCGPDDAVVEVQANGICRSDHHIWQGGWPWVGIAPQPPIILGHEFCGVVEEVGANVRRFKRRDRVAIPFNHSCGRCEQCQAGYQNVCLDPRFPMLHYTGGFGRYERVARADVNLVPLPPSISYLEAGAMGCRFMTSWHGVVDRAKVAAGEWVAVFGCGGIGLAAVNIAAALGANVIAVSRTSAKLEMAKQLGAIAAVNAADSQAVEQIVEMTNGGAHVSVDALGDAPTALPAIECLQSRGRHLRLGISSKQQGGTIPLPVDLFVFKELKFVGSLGMQAARFPAMLRMVESGKPHPGKLITDTVTIEEAGAALARMGQFSTIGMTVITEW